MLRLLTPIALAACLAGWGARPACAEIAVLGSGAVLKIASSHREGEQVRLVLKSGGELLVPASGLVQVLPDEVDEADLLALDEAQVAAAEPARPSTASGTRAALERLAEVTARRHGVDPTLVRAVALVESAFRPTAVSHKGAQGLMQLMPATARWLGVKDAFDPAQNLEGGVRYLKILMERYPGDLTRVLAAYNAGEQAVDRYRGVPPYRETQRYVKEILRRYEAARRSQDPASS